MKAVKAAKILVAVFLIALAAPRATAGADLVVRFDGFVVPSDAAYPTLDLGTWGESETTTYQFTAVNSASSGFLSFQKNASPRYVRVNSPYSVAGLDDLGGSVAGYTLAAGSLPATFTITLNTSSAGTTDMTNVDIDYLDWLGIQQHFRCKLSVLITSSAIPEISVRRSDNASPIPDLLAPAGIAFTAHQLINTSSAPQIVAIENLGSAALDITSVSIDPVANFELGALSKPSVEIHDSPATFSITFHPGSAGAKSTTVTIGNTDATDGEASYAFTVEGTGIAPVVSVDRAGLAIPPAGYVFSDTPVGTSSAAVTFNIHNNGEGDLVLSNWPNPVSSSDPTHFPIDSQPTTQTIPYHSEPNTFTVSFAPDGTSQRSADITIKSNGSDYTFKVTGTGYVPPGTSISPPTNLRIKDGLYYGLAPFKVRLVPGTYTDDNPTTPKQFWWDLDGSGNYSKVIPMTPASPLDDAAVSVTLPAPGTLTVGLVVLSSDDHLSAPVSITLAAYPNETASFPWVAGLPFDSAPPFIDGILSGNDGHPDPVGSTTVVYGENGWQGAFAAPYADGTEPPHLTVQLVRDVSFLYFAFDVNFDEDLTGFDQIQVGIGNADAARITDRGNVGLITLTPVVPAAPAPPSLTVTMSAKAADGTWQPVTILPAGTQAGVRNQTAGVGHHWSAELKVPYTQGAGPGGWLNLGAQIILFVDLIKAEDDSGPPPVVPTYTHFRWPRTLPSGVTAPELHSEWWGLATCDNSTPSNGLALRGYSSVGVRNAADPTGSLLTSISFKTPPGNDVINTLVARVENDARMYVLDASGNRQPSPLPAPDVRVRFKIANWGIPSLGYWTEITAQPLPSEPTRKTQNPTGYADVPAGTLAGSTVTPKMQEFILDWKLTDTQIGQYPDAELVTETGLSKAHQCVLAEIETEAETLTPGTAAGAVNIVTKSAWNNMDFTPVNAGEPFVGHAEISGKGYDSFFTGDEARRVGDRKILLRLYAREWKCSAKTLAKMDKLRELAALARLQVGNAKVSPPKMVWASEPPYLEELRGYIRAAPAAISFTEYLVKAYLMTGKQGKGKLARFEEVVPIGSYGYVVRHLGSPEAWDVGIESNAGVLKIDNRTYIVTIARNKVARVVDRVKAIDPPTWSFGLLGGAGVPAGDPSPAAGIGGGGAFSANASLGRDELDREYFLQALLGFDYLPGTGGAAAWNAGSLALNFRVSFPFFRWMRPYLSVGGGAFLDDSSSPQPGAAVGAGLDLAVSRPLHIQVGADFLGNATRALFRVNAGVVYRIVK